MWLVHATFYVKCVLEATALKEEDARGRSSWQRLLYARKRTSVRNKAENEDDVEQVTYSESLHCDKVVF